MQLGFIFPYISCHLESKIERLINFLLNTVVSTFSGDYRVLSI